MRTLFAVFATVVVVGLTSTDLGAQVPADSDPLAVPAAPPPAAIAAPRPGRRSFDRVRAVVGDRVILESTRIKA